MAGSWKHATAADNQLLRNEDIVKMLENNGDWYEFAEEAYGMLYYLAMVLSGGKEHMIEYWVYQAGAHYKYGLQASPGTDGRLTPAREANVTGKHPVFVVREPNGDEAKTVTMMVADDEAYAILSAGQVWNGWKMEGE